MMLGVLAFLPTAKVLEHLMEYYRSFDSLRIACIITLSSRYANGDIQLAKLVPSLRKTDSSVLFLADCLNQSIVQVLKFNLRSVLLLTE